MAKLLVLVAMVGLAIGGLIIYGASGTPTCFGECTYAEMTYKAQLSQNEGLLGMAIIVGSLIPYLLYKGEEIGEDIKAQRKEAEKLSSAMAQRRQQPTSTQEIAKPKSMLSRMSSKD